MIIALVLTILIEGPVMLKLTSDKEWVKYNLYCNLVTNPILNVILALLREVVPYRSQVQKMLLTYYLPLTVLEVVVVFVEAWFYTLMTNETKKECFRRSLITNGVSAGVGIIVSLFYFIREV